VKLFLYLKAFYVELNVHNETSRLRAVVLGLANNNGPTPTVEEAYDQIIRAYYSTVHIKEEVIDEDGSF
jgi:hypothetical protein